MNILCSTEDDQSLYDELVRRFLPEVNQQCEDKCKLRKLDPHVGQEIAHQVFERVRKYKSFKNEKTKVRNPHKAVLAYLMVCAGRLFLNYSKKEKRQDESPDTYISDLRAEASATDPARLQEIKEKTALAFGRLTPREREVVLADLEHKRHTKYLPDDVTTELCERLGVKPDTIRKLRQTAKLKLQQAFNEFNEA